MRQIYDACGAGAVVTSSTQIDYTRGIDIADRAEGTVNSETDCKENHDEPDEFYQSLDYML